MNIEDIEHRVAAIEKRLHQPEQPKAAAPEPPAEPPVLTPVLDPGEDLASQIGKQFAQATTNMEW
jgi:hypothetical protein